jgi:hypothetical protein
LGHRNESFLWKGTDGARERAALARARWAKTFGEPPICRKKIALATAGRRRDLLQRQQQSPIAPIGPQTADYSPRGIWDLGFQISDLDEVCLASIRRVIQ